MKVYVVNLSYDYEGETTEGVFSTLDNAIKFVEETTLRGDSMAIYEYTIDHPTEASMFLEPVAQWSNQRDYTNNTVTYTKVRIQ